MAVTSDPYVSRLIALRDDLRSNALVFCSLIEANDGAIEVDSVAAVRDLIEAAMNAIEDMPI